MVETRSNREIVESVYEAIGDVYSEGGIQKGNINHLRQVLVEDIEWIHPALRGAYHGIESVINDVMLPFWETWEVTLDSPRYIVDGDTIIVLAIYHAKHKPSGNLVIEPVAHAWDLKDGKVIRLHQYVGTASIKKQVEA